MTTKGIIRKRVREYRNVGAEKDKVSIFVGKGLDDKEKTERKELTDEKRQTDRGELQKIMTYIVWEASRMKTVLYFIVVITRSMLNEDEEIFIFQ